MIISTTRAAARTVDQTLWRCLARRGMVHSECEAFDYVRLAPGAVHDGRGRQGNEEAWFVLNGQGEFRQDENRWIPVRAGDLILCSWGANGWLRSGADSSLEMLLLAVLPPLVTDQLPARRPVAETE